VVNTYRDLHRLLDAFDAFARREVGLDALAAAFRPDSHGRPTDLPRPVWSAVDRAAEQVERIRSMPVGRRSSVDRVRRGIEAAIAAHGGLPPRRFPCPCCGFLTLDEEPPGTYAICPVCYWEDDQVQFRDPDYRGGANQLSLREAREHFRQFGACEPRVRPFVRPPRDDERPSPHP
jgi:hypothetical protein